MKNTIKTFQEFMNEQNNFVNENIVKSEADFRDWAEAYLKKAHGDGYDEEKANQTINGLIDKYGDDWGAMIGALKS